jgi:arginine/ornithine transport system permease protein
MLHGYAASLLEGMLLTLAVALVSLVIACVLGLAGSAAKLSRSPLLRHIATLYTTLIRGVPDLVLMLLVFFGGQVFVNFVMQQFGGGNDSGIDVDPFIAGVLTIGFIFGGYLTETFRGAFLAVPVGQREAALAFGMSRLQVLRRITAPQMLRHALPALSNNWLVLVKSTAIVSVIGLNDMMQKAGQAAGATHEPFVFYAAVGLLYLLITSVSEIGFSWLDRRTSRSLRPRS